MTRLISGMCAVAVMAGLHGQTSAAPAQFRTEAEHIYKVVACGGASAKRTAHCRILHKRYERYRKKFVAVARPFIAKLRPTGLPTAVVYPFGGGDLMTALTTYPSATEITTMSLESGGDPTRVAKLKGRALQNNLRRYRARIIFLLGINQSRNTGLRSFERGAIPGQVSFSLMAAAVYGYKPVSLRYFRVETDGSLHYYSREEIAGLRKKKGRRLSGRWLNTDFSVAYRNMEIRYQKIGNGPGPTSFVHRHIAANLDNKHVVTSGVLKHLERKGKVSAMTKAASYLLWFDSFSIIRNYLLKNMAWMIADATGILPHHARAAGWEPTTYGKFYAAYLKNRGGKNAAIMRKLWRSQPHRKIPFRYGYSDIYGARHLVVYNRKR